MLRSAAAAAAAAALASFDLIREARVCSYLIARVVDQSSPCSFSQWSVSVFPQALAGHWCNPGKDKVGDKPTRHLAGDMMAHIRKLILEVCQRPENDLSNAMPFPETRPEFGFGVSE